MNSDGFKTRKYDWYHFISRVVGERNKRGCYIIRSNTVYTSLGGYINPRRGITEDDGSVRLTGANQYRTCGLLQTLVLLCCNDFHRVPAFLCPDASVLFLFTFLSYFCLLLFCFSFACFCSFRFPVTALFFNPFPSSSHFCSSLSSFSTERIFFIYLFLFRHTH